MWNNRQLLTPEWISAATSKQISNDDGSPGAASSDWSQGYGYQFWQCQHGGFRGDGAFGQLCIVMPEQDAVVAITSGSSDIQRIMNGVWEHLLPAMRTESSVAPNGSAANAELALLLDRLSFQPERQKEASVLEAFLNGKVFRMDDNPQQLEAVSVSFNTTEALLMLQGMYGKQIIKLGRGKWVESFAQILDSTKNLISSSFT
ncbi:hypothetical protein A3842_07030 [Paenibacillus sp. P3E]|nr:hypothetical protein A3842_07030 [Paenibacillus sp. P3E]